MPPTIKNIVFDLGGVVIDIDAPASFSAMQQLAAESVVVTERFSEHTWVFLDYEKGLVSDEAFRDGIRQLTRQPHLADGTIDQAWCRMLLNIPKERLQLLARLQKRYRTFVLSNTNAIHVEAFNKMVASVSGQPTVDHFFEKVYYSHELQMRKPEAEIYQYVLADSNLRPAETLFLEDREENLVAAQALGIITQLVTPQQDIIRIFAPQP